MEHRKWFLCCDSSEAFSLVLNPLLWLNESESVLTTRVVNNSPVIKLNLWIKMYHLPGDNES